LDTEGASQPDSEPAGESLRSRDLTEFCFWRVGGLEAPDADGANLEDNSRRISQASQQRMRGNDPRVLLLI
jgi:hypothetical protein